jgi:hypothetical protein
MEAVSTSETSVIIYESTRCNIPEDSYLHTRRREKIKYHLHIYTVCCNNFRNVSRLIFRLSVSMNVNYQSLFIVLTTRPNFNAKLRRGSCSLNIIRLYSVANPIGSPLDYRFSQGVSSLFSLSLQSNDTTATFQILTYSCSCFHLIRLFITSATVSINLQICRETRIKLVKPTFAK